MRGHGVGHKRNATKVTLLGDHIARQVQKFESSIREERRVEEASCCAVESCVRKKHALQRRVVLQDPGENLEARRAYVTGELQLGLIAAHDLKRVAREQAQPASILFLQKRCADCVVRGGAIRARDAVQADRGQAMIALQASSQVDTFESWVCAQIDVLQRAGRRRKDLLEHSTAGFTHLIARQVEPDNFVVAKSPLPETGE
mmetsp:Transcript_16691/g.45285  ORF Transcript_16691/g.45285 Transcript_16691/m.45285 type:complete len:202 (-) Transcript_16691:252-857(-)